MADPQPSSDPAAGDGGGNNNTELLIAIAALVISVAAFVVSIAQALQQYYSSARGYSSCGPTVIGKWAAYRHRRFRWYEFRFEVQFLTPVIFVARPSNKRGPMGRDEYSKITVLDGGAESYEGAGVPRGAEERRDREKRMAEPGRVHTADNERATWLDLLMAVERMEEESRAWQGSFLREYEGQEAEGEEWPPKVAGGHTLCVCIQRKKKSWDTVPDNVTKPYATTTIAHMVEVAAMLGVYWIVWNREDDRYLAQGNGYILSGANIEGLGLTFSIQQKGPATWAGMRLVPHNAVKELCFGFCPTIFRPLGDNAPSADESRGIGSLALGSMEEVAETLVVLGCNVRNVNYFRDAEGKARFSHLFPITFEILGMLSIVFQVKGTVFRTLPNPTVFRWDTKSFNLVTLLEDYRTTLNTIPPSSSAFSFTTHFDSILGSFSEWTAINPDSPTRVSRPPGAALLASTTDIESQKPSDNNTITHRRWALPKTLSTVTAQTFKSRTSYITTAEDKMEKPVSPRATYSPAIFSALHDAIAACDEYLNPLENSATGSLLRVVIRAHVQAVLGMLNPGSGTGGQGAVSPTSPTTRLNTDTAVNTPSIEDLDAASDGKHRLLMDMYFGRVRREVVRKAAGGSGGEMEEKAGGIWDVLVFRMLCWLLLHQFHEKDVQLGGKSDVFESRMPVYVI